MEYSTWRTRSVCFGNSVKKQTEKLKLEEKHMKKYIGTKLVQARPMTRGAYNRYRGWEIPADENPEDEGYLIQYPDGYVSWSPKGMFDHSYLEVDDNPQLPSGVSIGPGMVEAFIDQVEVMKLGERTTVVRCSFSSFVMAWMVSSSVPSV